MYFNTSIFNTRLVLRIYGVKNTVVKIEIEMNFILAFSDLIKDEIA